MKKSWSSSLVLLSGLLLFLLLARSPLHFCAHTHHVFTVFKQTTTSTHVYHMSQCDLDKLNDTIQFIVPETHQFAMHESKTYLTIHLSDEVDCRLTYLHICAYGYLVGGQVEFCHNLDRRQRLQTNIGLLSTLPWLNTNNLKI